RAATRRRPAPDPAQPVAAPPATPDGHSAAAVRLAPAAGPDRLAAALRAVAAVARPAALRPTAALHVPARRRPAARSIREWRRLPGRPPVAAVLRSDGAGVRPDAPDSAPAGRCATAALRPGGAVRRCA